MDENSFRLRLLSHINFKMAPPKCSLWLSLFTLSLYHIIICNSNTLHQYEYPSHSLACKTHSMTELDCSHRYLVDMPVFNQNLTTTLDLSVNLLPEIKGAPFEQMPLLRILDLSYNQIASLSSTAFRGIWLIEKLELSMNQIVALPKDIFFNLTKLESINLLTFMGFPAVPYVVLEL